jgi:hypothetical protein
MRERPLRGHAARQNFPKRYSNATNWPNLECRRLPNHQQSPRNRTLCWSVLVLPFELGLKRDEIKSGGNREGTALPLPLAGRGIAYGNFESFPRLGHGSMWRSNRLPRNRTENKPESKLVQPFCLDEEGRPEETAASSGFSICDTPALAGEGWGGCVSAIDTPDVERAPTRRFAPTQERASLVSTPASGRGAANLPPHRFNLTSSRFSKLRCLSLISP